MCAASQENATRPCLVYSMLDLILAVLTLKMCPSMWHGDCEDKKPVEEKGVPVPVSEGMSDSRTSANLTETNGFLRRGTWRGFQGVLLGLSVKLCRDQQI